MKQSLDAKFLPNKTRKNENVNFLKGESDVVLCSKCTKSAKMPVCKVVRYKNVNASSAPAKSRLGLRWAATPPVCLLFGEVWEERKPCSTGFSSLAWPDKPQHRNVLSQFSSPVPASPAEFLQCRKSNLFLSLFKIMGKIYVSWGCHNFPFDSSAAGTVVPAFNARLWNFHIFWKCECRFLSFRPQRPERICCILWQSWDYSFLLQAQHWGEVISLPNSECKVIRRRKWKTGSFGFRLRVLDFFLFRSDWI